MKTESTPLVSTVRAPMTNTSPSVTVVSVEGGSIRLVGPDLVLGHTLEDQPVPLAAGQKQPQHQSQNGFPRHRGKVTG